MSDKKRKVPKLRFPGFTDAWEQRNLGELIQIERGGSPRPIEQYITSDSNGLNWIKIGDAPKQGNYITETSEKIKPSGLSKTRQVIPGDLILSNSMSFGRPYIMAIEGCIHDGWLLIRDTNEKFDKLFLCNLLGSPMMIEQYKSMAAGSTVNNLNKELVSSAKVPVPKITEQILIGAYLDNFDSLISLHQRKLDNVKMLKKSLLQKLFPKDGEKIPELRFPGFTDDWEQRKLESVLLVSTEKNIRNEYSRNEVLSVSREAGTVNQIEYQGRSFAGEDLSGYKVVHEGELIYTKSPLRGAPYGIFQVATIRGILSPLYAVYKSSNLALASFVATYLKNDSVATKYLAPLVTKGAKNTINVTDEGALKGKILIPQVAEQQRIYSLFVKIDGLLSLHQRTLDHLKELKKGLLQQMFV